ncbi:Pentatricopeptide repeat-containing protein [Apostasia shenzhenica]|uniref:Pentatricopeptide repeat-containing protein n=1 Tax=Apostasia shenzhenica TaxID=1088818 RepID=A0A2I0A318_9ASPA|nr:Pentatricopeptide repeat-containing protein [Apostasia shenzhenica]
MLQSALAVTAPPQANLNFSAHDFPKNKIAACAPPSPFLPLLHRCRSTSEVYQVHGAIIKSGEGHDRFLLFQLLRRCSSLHSIDYASRIFESVKQPDVYHWTALIAGIVAGDFPLDAVLLYSQMMGESIAPDAVLISYVLKACGSQMALEEGKQIHGQVLKLSFGFERAVLMRLIGLYGGCGEFADAKKVFDEMPDRDAVAGTVLISCYSDRGLIDEALGVFCGVPERDTVCWTSMIDGLVRNGREMAAVNLFREMQRENVQPNEITIVCLLSACARLGALQLGKWVDSYLGKYGIRRNTFVCSTLIDMYCKCGSVEEAMKVFDGMPRRDVISYNSMIAGLAVHGKSLEAVQLYRKMIRLGFKPTHITFVAVLNACSHGGLVDLGFEMFESMEKVHGLLPEVEHYGCMVDLLGRVGRLQDAFDMIQEMRVEPDHVIWGALLGACRIHGNLALAKKIGQILISSEKADSGTFVLLANSYSSFGKWEDAARMRAILRERGMQKEPGCSSIEIDNELHEFLLGDIKHPQRKEIYEKLEEMTVLVKKEGYSPAKSEVLQDVQDQEKQWALAIHSERLAICFGLISTKPGKTIRVMKNLRVCGDCHSMIKLIAKVTGRKIVVRDRNRFHHFEDGSCSCGDYW